MYIELVQVKDKKYHVKRVIASANVTEDMTDTIKTLLGCDTILRRGDKTYFVDSCIDIDIESRHMPTLP